MTVDDPVALSPAERVFAIPHLRRKILIHRGRWTAERAAELGRVDVFEELGHTFTYTTFAIDVAAENGHLRVVEWLHVNRTEGCTTCAMDWAARNGHLAVVQWLHENRTEGCTTYAMDWASRRSAGGVRVNEQRRAASSVTDHLLLLPRVMGADKHSTWRATRFREIVVVGYKTWHITRGV
jgi:Ankyrin repeats (many copies)